VRFSIDRKAVWQRIKRIIRFLAITAAIGGLSLSIGYVGGMAGSGYFDTEGPELTEFQRNWDATVEVVRPDGGWGSGVVITKQGHIITAAHVLQGIEGRTVMVKMDGNAFIRTYDAEIIVVDEARDLGLLRLPGEYANPALLEIRDVPPYPGDATYSIGFPAELGGAKIANTNDVRILDLLPPLNRAEWPASYNTLLLNNRLEPGYSGGGIFLNRNGRLTGIIILELWTVSGMLTYREAPLVVPMRRIRPFLDENYVPYRYSEPNWFETQWYWLERELGDLADRYL
jgi:S1-C subfamily serine protease